MEINKNRATSITLYSLRIIGEIVLGTIIGCAGIVLIGILLQEILPNAPTFIYIIAGAVIYAIVSSLVVYFIGKIGKHYGSYWLTLVFCLCIAIYAAILIIIFTVIITLYDFNWLNWRSFTIMIVFVPVIGAAVGFNVSKRIKNVRWAIGVTLVGFVLAGLLGHTALDIYVRGIIKNEIREIKEKGEPVSFSDFTEMTVLDKQNSAPIYREICSLLSASDDKSSKLYMIRAANGNYSEWTENQKKEIPVILEKYNKVIELAHEAAIMPYCNFNIDYSDLEQFKINNFRFSDLSYSVCHLLSVKSALDKENGQMEKALEKIFDGLMMARALGKTKLYIGSIGESVCNVVMLSRLEKLLTDSDISYQSYQKLYDLLKRQRKTWKTDRLVGYYSIRYMIISLFKQTQQLPSLLSPEVSPDGKRTLQPSSYLGHWPFVTFYKWRAINHLKDYTDVIELTKKPNWETKSGNIHLRTIGFYFYRDSLSTQLGDAELAVALRMYKAKNGHYPMSLKEIVPDIVKELPLDNFTGKDYIYKRVGNGFIVYSLGENMKDDKGKPDDIVWKSDI